MRWDSLLDRLETTMDVFPLAIALLMALQCVNSIDPTEDQQYALCSNLRALQMMGDRGGKRERKKKMWKEKNVDVNLNGKYLWVILFDKQRRTN